MDDDALIAALAAGDDMALRELFMRHAPWLAARLRAALPPPDVEDVLQETFLAVWKGADLAGPSARRSRCLDLRVPRLRGRPAAVHRLRSPHPPQRRQLGNPLSCVADGADPRCRLERQTPLRLGPAAPDGLLLWLRGGPAPGLGQ